MRAKKVFENINFKRGMEPSKSLDLGRDRKIINPTSEQVLNLEDGEYYQIESAYPPKYGVIKIRISPYDHYQVILYAWDDDLEKARWNAANEYEAEKFDPEEIENSFLEAYDVESIKRIGDEDFQSLRYFYKERNK